MKHVLRKVISKLTPQYLSELMYLSELKERIDHARLVYSLVYFTTLSEPMHRADVYNRLVGEYNSKKKFWMKSIKVN